MQMGALVCVCVGVCICVCAIILYQKYIYYTITQAVRSMRVGIARAYARMCVCVYAGTRIYIRVCTHIYTRRVTLARKPQSGTGRFSRIGRGHGEVWAVGRGCTGRYVKIFS